MVGVFGNCLEGGGLRLRSALLCSCSAAILFVVGVLNGPRLIGGSLRGCRCLLPCGVLLCSVSAWVLFGAYELFRALGLRWTLVGSGKTGIEILPVGLELELSTSILLKAVFFFSMKYVSAGESFGDSYALGMAGTGGTSSSSSAGIGLCTVVCLGAGNRDVDEGCETRGCVEPIEVLTVLKLMDEVTERPELYDFRLISGVVLDEDGVPEAFLGIMEGDLDSARVSMDTGGGGGTFEDWLKLGG